MQAKRRTLIAGLSALPLTTAPGLVRAQAKSADPGVSATEILLGSSGPMTGPLSAGNNQYREGLRVYFEGINAKGGIFGRKIREIAMDDAFNLDRGKANIKKLIEEDKVFAFMGISGTGLNLNVAPVLEAAGIPNFAPLTGSDAVKALKNKTQFPVGASYGDELEKMVEQLTSTGVRNIGVAFQDDPFGKAVLAGADAAIKKRNLTLQTVGYKPDGSNLADAVAQLAKGRPDAVIMGGAGRQVVGFIGAYQKTGLKPQFFCISISDSTLLVKELGAASRGVAVSQIAPFPWDTSIPVVKEYQAAWKAATNRTDFSYNGLTAFLWAKVFSEGLKRAGRDLTRAKLIAALESMAGFDAGGYLVNFSPDNHVGSRFVELTIIGAEGRFLR